MRGIVELPDERLRYVSHEIIDATILLYTESITEHAVCPYCGAESDKVHSHYRRTLQDLPIQGNKVKIIINNKKYFCANKDCNHKTFAETFSFYKPNATKTKRLEEEILRVSLTQSSLAAEKYLRKSVAKVGKSTICNLLKKLERTFDKTKIVSVCIDDFALKKRQRYGTMMVDLESRKLIDMIESREMIDVKAWLEGYPNLQLVSRDVNMPDKDILKENQTVRGREHEEAVEKLKRRAELVRILHEEGLSIATIGVRTGFCSGTVRNYLSENFSPVTAHYGKQREGKLEPFRSEVLKLKSEGFKYREIHAIIKDKGYVGTQDAIRGFISKERRIQQDVLAESAGTQELIDKKWLIRLLYRSIEDVKD